MALHYAIRNKLLSEVRSLVEGGANVNHADKDRRTPLMMCCLEEDESWAAGVARMLLQAGAKVGYSDKEGRNSLMYSSIFGREELNDLFLKAVDFNLNKKDSIGNTALHFSALKGNDNIMSKLVIAFTRTKRDINERNRIGQTAAGLALHLGNVACVELIRHRYGNQAADFSTKVPTVLLLRPWNTDLQFLQDPKLMLKIAMNDILDGSKMYCSKPKLNVHQFRRGTQDPGEDFSLKRKNKKKRMKCNSCKAKVHPSMISLKQERVSISENNFRLKNESDANYTNMAFSRVDKHPLKSHSWRDVVPDLLDVLKVQVSPSYRASAIAVKQTYEEAFNIATEKSDSNLSESEEINDKPLLSPGQTNRRKSSIHPGVLTRTRSKSEMFSNMTFQPLIEGRRRNRRISMQVGSPESAVGQTRKISDKLPGFLTEPTTLSLPGTENGLSVPADIKRRNSSFVSSSRPPQIKVDGVTKKKPLETGSTEKDNRRNSTVDSNRRNSTVDSNRRNSTVDNNRRNSTVDKLTNRINDKDSNIATQKSKDINYSLSEIPEEHE